MLVCNITDVKATYLIQMLAMLTHRALCRRQRDLKFILYGFFVYGMVTIVVVEYFHYGISIMVSARGIALWFFLGYVNIHRIRWWVDIRQVGGL